MLRITTLLIITLLPLVTTAQLNHQFLDELSTWEMLRINPFVNGNEVDYIPFEHRVSLTFFENDSAKISTLTESEGFYIEDKLNSRVLWLLDSDTVTLYDFGMHVGDTLRTGVFDINYPDELAFGTSPYEDSLSCLLVVTDSGATNVLDSQRLTLTVDVLFADTADSVWYGGEVTWIDGIGEANGPNYLLTGMFFEASVHMTCFVYDTTNAYGCPPLGQEAVKQDEFKTPYPNPFSNELYVDLPSGSTDLRIIDLTGRVVFQQSITESKLSLGHLKNGIYLIQISTEKETFSRRVIKAD